MFNVERLSTNDLIDLQQDISYAVDMSFDEKNYTILDEIENTLQMRESVESLTDVTVAENADYGDFE